MAESFVVKGFWVLRSGWGFARFLKSFVQGSLRFLKRCKVGLGRSVWWYNFGGSRNCTLKIEYSNGFRVLLFQ
jgi:hypothetical protein